MINWDEVTTPLQAAKMRGEAQRARESRCAAEVREVLTTLDRLHDARVRRAGFHVVHTMEPDDAV